MSPIYAVVLSLKANQLLLVARQVDDLVKLVADDLLGWFPRKRLDQHED